MKPVFLFLGMILGIAFLSAQSQAGRRRCEGRINQASIQAQIHSFEQNGYSFTSKHSERKLNQFQIQSSTKDPLFSFFLVKYNGQKELILIKKGLSHQEAWLEISSRIPKNFITILTRGSLELAKSPKSKKNIVIAIAGSPIGDFAKRHKQKGTRALQSLISALAEMFPHQTQKELILVFGWERLPVMKINLRSTEDL